MNIKTKLFIAVITGASLTSGCSSIPKLEELMQESHRLGCEDAFRLNRDAKGGVFGPSVCEPMSKAMDLSRVKRYSPELEVVRKRHRSDVPKRGESK